MDIRVITLRYQDGLQGFPEEALRTAISGREVLEARDHFFLHGNVPHVSLTLLLGDAPAGGEGPRRRDGADLEESLAESQRPLYRELRRWRNERAREEGRPAYAVARNAQLVEIVRRQPRTLSELKETEGIGESFCRDYGTAVLGLMPEITKPLIDSEVSEKKPDEPKEPSGNVQAGVEEKGSR